MFYSKFQLISPIGKNKLFLEFLSLNKQSNKKKTRHGVDKVKLYPRVEFVAVK